MRDGRVLLSLLIVGILILPTSSALAATASFAWGNFTATSFDSTHTVVGIAADDTPYYKNPVAWTGPDKSLAFVATISTPWSEPQNIPFFQVALLARYNTVWVDEVYQLPGQTSLTDVCAQFSRGDYDHRFQIARIINGWALLIDGVNIVTETCGCLSSDYVDQGYNQEPLALEAASTLSQSAIDNSFKMSQSNGIFEQQSPVVTGNWLLIPHGYSYYTNTGLTCTNSNVGTTNPPNWAAVAGFGAQGNDYTQIGTTTYFGPLTCGSAMW